MVVGRRSSIFVSESQKRSGSSRLNKVANDNRATKSQIMHASIPCTRWRSINQPIVNYIYYSLLVFEKVNINHDYWKPFWEPFSGRLGQDFSRNPFWEPLQESQASFWTLAIPGKASRKGFPETSCPNCPENGSHQ